MFLVVYGFFHFCHFYVCIYFKISIGCDDLFFYIHTSHGGISIFDFVTVLFENVTIVFINDVLQA